MQNFFWGGRDWGGKQGVLWRCANDEYDILISKNVALVMDHGHKALGIWECGSHCNDLFQRPPNNSFSVRNAVNHLHFSFFSLGLV